MYLPGAWAVLSFCKGFCEPDTGAVTVPRTAILGGVHLKPFKMKLRKKELARLIQHIQESYAGDYASVSRDLNKAVYCLHFLAKDEIPRHEIQDLCFALHKLGECFHQAYRRQNESIRNPNHS